MVRVLLLLTLAAAPVLADEVRVAVASNFRVPLDEIVLRFENKTGHEVSVSSGSTGKLFAQIMNGAPFDIFLAADSERPQRLEVEGLAVANSRFTYALGRLALWSMREDLPAHFDTVFSPAVKTLAIANPELAPYGRATAQILFERGVQKPINARIARGENIGQTYAFVASGNADVGFVAVSQILQGEPGGWYVEIPESLHEPIRQDAVLLKRAADNGGAHAFMRFLGSPASAAVLKRFGYGDAQ